MRRDKIQWGGGKGKCKSREEESLQDPPEREP